MLFLKRSSVVILTVMSTLGAAFASPGAMAQLRGNWQDDGHWHTQDESASTRIERVSTQSGSDFAVPRGDLRKDVSDASHGGPRSRAR